MSKTLIPDPVARAMLASGQRVHQCRMIDSSSVASRSPRLVRGCFAGDLQLALPQLQRPSTTEWQGKIRQPMRAYATAASSFAFTAGSSCRASSGMLCGSWRLIPLGRLRRPGRQQPAADGLFVCGSASCSRQVFLSSGFFASLQNFVILLFTSRRDRVMNCVLTRERPSWVNLLLAGDECANAGLMCTRMATATGAAVRTRPRTMRGTSQMSLTLCIAFT